MATILVVGEQANGHLKKATLSALAAAQQIAQKTGGQIAGVVVGAGAGQSAQELAAYGIPVHVVEGAAFEHALAETHSAAAAEVAKKAGAGEVVIAATAYGKDIGPRIAAKLGAGLASDVLAIAGANQFKRAMWAGNAIATVEVTTPVKVVTVRATEFAAPQKAQGAGTVTPAQVAAPQPKTKFVEFNEVKSARPELTEARVVVSGGRGT
jgi:electron transfer flavoprotein alpha subunit